MSPEFLRSQIEIGTKVCKNVQEARADLKRLRRSVADVCLEYGLAPIASSTHPSADWWEQRHTDAPRYNILANALGGVIRRLLICGMHVHVGIEDPDVRIDLMNQVLYFVPHMLALSTSSPFWNGKDTGLKSYRTSVFRAVPRTGMPDEFDTWAEYQRHVDVLVRAGVIEDGTKLWWDLRPSARYPTLELRSNDICTNLEDTLTIASIFVSLLSMLWRRRVENQRWRIYSRMLIEENVWRAQRYGISDALIDFGRGELVPYPQLVEEIIDLISEDAVLLDCVEELHHAREIVDPRYLCRYSARHLPRSSDRWRKRDRGAAAGSRLAHRGNRERLRLNLSDTRSGRPGSRRRSTRCLRSTGTASAQSRTVLAGSPTSHRFGP